MQSSLLVQRTLRLGLAWKFYPYWQVLIVLADASMKKQIITNLTQMNSVSMIVSALARHVHM